MKPGSKTRTRQTLGGGTKTVTKSKSSSGAKTRIVEHSKGDFYSGKQTTRKIRRSDKSGVSKIKSTTTNYPFSLTDYSETVQTKNTFRKRGSLLREKRPLQESVERVKRPEQKEHTGTNIRDNRTLGTKYEKRNPIPKGYKSQISPHFVVEKTSVREREKLTGRNNVSRKKTEFPSRKEAKQQVRDIGTLKDAKSIANPFGRETDKKTTHYRAAKQQKKMLKDTKYLFPNASNAPATETGSTYTPYKGPNKKRAQREFLKQFPK